MMDYETRQELSRKADANEVHALRSEIITLKHQNEHLSRNVSHLEGRLSNHYSAIEKLLQLIIDRELMPDDVNTLYALRQYL